jgi:hypothetical protein
MLVVVMVAAGASASDGLALMKVEHGARIAGMGSAAVSLVDDPNGTAYNPAGIMGIRKFTASFGHTAYWENVRLESGYFAMNLSERMFVHGGIRFASVDNLQQRLIPSAEPQSYFDAHDISFKAGVSYLISPKVSVGLASGWYMEKIQTYQGSSFNIDAGLLAKATDRLNIGASITNLGSDFALHSSGAADSRKISLPTTYAAGASYSYDKYTGAMDFVVLDSKAHLHVGAEAKVHELFQVRAGYLFNYDSKNITAGASFTQRNLTIDYAFVPYTNNLGTSHMFNLTFSL